jgi:hypothetical protein
VTGLEKTGGPINITTGNVAIGVGITLTANTWTNKELATDWGIYAVRIYNRILSAGNSGELKKNYRVDSIRFLNPPKIKLVAQSNGAQTYATSVAVNSAGILTFTTPSLVAGTYEIWYEHGGKSVNTRQMYTVGACSNLRITTPSRLPQGMVNNPYTMLIKTTCPVTTWSISGNPSWLHLNQSGVLYGTPPKEGRYTFNISIDGGASREFILQVGEQYQIMLSIP